MNWTLLESEKQLAEIQEASDDHPVLIFKHSTSCSISRTVLGRFERSWKTEEVKKYFLDLLAYRDISKQIADLFQVEHESPQLLIIYKRKAIHHSSHFEIEGDQIEKWLMAQPKN